MTKKLPEGWTIARLSELGQFYGGATPSKAKPEFWAGGDIPWVSPKDMRQEILDTVQDRITHKALESSPVRLIPTNSVAFVVRSGVLEKRFPVGLTVNDVTLNQDMKAIHPNEAVDARWLAWGLRWMEQSILHDCRKAGTTVASIETSRLMSVHLPLPPLAEQRRIISTLETELTRLKSAQALLDKSLIRAGRLVERFTDTELDSFSSEKVTPLKELLREPLRNGHSAPAAREGGIRTLTLTAITKGVFSDTHTKMTSTPPRKASGLWLEPGDIFIQRSNTPDLVGTSAVYQGPSGWAIFPDLLVRVRISDHLDPRFVLAVLKSTRVRAHFKDSAKGLSGSMPKIDQRTIEEVLIPVPDIKTQRDTADRIDEYSRSVTIISKEVEKARERTGHLRRALLTAAFNGKLAPQDPADEPASLLLDRIRDDSAAAPKRKRRNRSTANQTPILVRSDTAAHALHEPRPVHAGEQIALEF
ncbi:restriction endonuclease subunit S [Nocardiopsis sediminis]|uniref:Restriction endonuclease subunit S n=1 Tax=Nocardiopsis sediminis TaxID=1778267 RepID=A0ABV8FGG4_9ACTN